MNDHGRNIIVDELKRELIGPDPHGPGIDLTGEISFPTRQEARAAFTNALNGEEIITSGMLPKRRYATGVLFPLEGAERSVEAQGNLLMDEDEASAAEEVEFSDLDPNLINEVADDDFELSPVNDRDPSSAAITFVLSTHAKSIRVEVAGGRYDSVPVKIRKSDSETDSSSASKAMTWYSRVPVSLIFEGAILNENTGFVELPLFSGDLGPLKISCFILAREADSDGSRFCTVAVRNSSPTSGDSFCLFQTEISVTSLDESEKECEFLPYPDRSIEALKARDPEIANSELLFRDQLTFAVGHGCSGNWKLVKGSCLKVTADYFPTYEAPSVTPIIFDQDGNSLEIKMEELLDCAPGTRGLNRLKHLISEYEVWITKIEKDSERLEDSHSEAASRNIFACRDALRRMRAGLSLIESNEQVRRSFELANEAVLFQQSQIPRRTREIKWNSKSKTYEIEAASSNKAGTFGTWRPFQIGYILSSISSTIYPDDPDREVVDLIFFPTGGGKTEAYQALIAISLFYSRLTKKEVGVEVIMRYTLRLLTAQQFLRAASLIASMEVIREKHELSGKRFTIGIWVGKATSPLKRDNAKSLLKSLRKSQDLNHPFVLTRCPLCSTSMGAVAEAPNQQRWPGLELSKSEYTGNVETVIFTCPNFECRFSDELFPIPAIVIDEDIFDRKPSLVIATLDKFAQVAFSDQIRSLFGLNSDGDRALSPPSLIIQDELHLISGPLGSISGIYEALFDEFCRIGMPAGSPGPKIVASTATIRSAANQVLGLYGRPTMDIFPPSGIDAGDSFFARYARDEDGELAQGQLFVGAIGTSLGSVQDLQSRVAASLLQAPMRLETELRDPWTTNLAFFNRIQDIGTSFSLLRINARAMLKTLWTRKGITETKDKRFINENALMELTSRIDSNRLPSTIEKLSVSYPNYQVDICLASNIIEVGIDIQRLSLMTMLGQPKTTSQYIQVAGRVGRDWSNRPGLIVVQYPPRRARDRSHFEKFRSFHQRLYANVEPTSVTPWSTQVMERALHAVIVGYIRNTAKSGLPVLPFPAEQFNEAVKVARSRLLLIEPDQIEHFERIAQRRGREWEEWQRSVWTDYKSGADNPLLNPAGNYLSPEKRLTTWETMMSMRNVDAECAVKILSNSILEEE